MFLFVHPIKHWVEFSSWFSSHTGGERERKGKHDRTKRKKKNYFTHKTLHRHSRYIVSCSTKYKLNGWVSHLFRHGQVFAHYFQNKSNYWPTLAVREQWKCENRKCVSNTSQLCLMCAGMCKQGAFFLSSFGIFWWYQHFTNFVTIQTILKPNSYLFENFISHLERIVKLIDQMLIKFLLKRQRSEVNQ